jgi:hypothetical protein
VDAHARVAPIPVEPRGDALARLQGTAARRHVHDARPVGPVNRVGDGDLAVAIGEMAHVARLSAALGIEHGAVEHDAALRGESHDAGVALPGIRIVAEKKRGGGHGMAGKDRWRATLRMGRLPCKHRRAHAFPL